MASKMARVIALGELSLKNSKREQLYIDGVFLLKACFSSKMSEKLCVMTLKGDAKFTGKLTCGLKNDLRHLVNFHASSRKY